MKQMLIGCFFVLLLLSHIVIADDTLNEEQFVEQLQSLQVFSGALDAVDFHPDGTMLASGGRDDYVRLWDTETGENLVAIDAHDDWVMSVRFSPDGTTLASGSRDNSIHLWDVATGERLDTIGFHRGDITDLAFSPDGEILASSGRDGVIQLHHLPTRENIATIENFGGNVWDIEFSHDGTMLASGSEDGSIWLWGLWDENETWLRKLEGHTAPVASLAFSLDDSALISGSLDGNAHHYNLDGLSDDSETPNLPNVVMRGHLAPVMGIGWTADEAVVVTLSLDGTIRLWDVGDTIKAGKMLNTISNNGAPLTNLTMNNQKSQAASVGTDGVLNLWDVSEETISALIESQRPVTIANVQSNPATTRTTLIDPAPTNPQSPVSPPEPPTLPASGRTISIPSAGIQSSVGTFYLDGVSWAIDPWERTVGHLQGTAWVTGNGNMVLGGHSTYPDGRRGVFYNLYNVGIGDEIYVRDGGTQRRYVVVNILEVDYRDVSVVYPTAHNQLTLITCDVPSFSEVTGTYLERLVIIANEI
jgi:LPXTG-site transpeptidase (sortase) family protein